MTSAVEELVQAFGEQKPFRELVRVAKKARTVGLERLAGSAFSVAAAAALRSFGGIHVFVCADKDGAAYLAGDLYNLLGSDNILFFPTAHKHSIQFGEQDPSGVIQRTAVLGAISGFEKGFLAICTYPEALTEKVISRTELTEKTLTLKVGETVSMSAVEDILVDWNFARVDFVYEPGQYSIRGGVFDIFSYSAPKPYRLDFFGDEIENIKAFEISSQLSAEKVASMEVLPNFEDDKGDEISLARYVPEAVWWIDDLGYTLKMLDKISSGGKDFLADTSEAQMFTRTGSPKREPEVVVKFETAPQPKFNKQFEMLAGNIADNAAKGYQTYILSENRAQIERLIGIFASTHSDVKFIPLPLTLHEGFVDHELKVCLYTDHQIFDRYHRYKIRGEINRDEALTVAELNEMKVPRGGAIRRPCQADRKWPRGRCHKVGL